ncbi:MAG: 2-C-methyl-D-erythritol 4-phosphate cytidylyltransferase [Prevotella sp.]|uniref:2-C-methyl-D-erythritol 4-phosphate cytidylyltransferase n=1 Tax=Prevotella sp. TaxID=59823 RepID=UPI002A2B8422|nr:2-C-methyl-D-erythritol 4-phosphate cytidylyltransferase [Prevotella sp.]MDD7317720.1 2-C-methyl-D-erythritol 4-phosphate cytidylyltransferase [Prevotellaceae bacterium]MDY4020635.1 2-C-methyl-D-erythritol 4-phosphate cytidylyltransferase [Prevotella sp.]
METNNFDNRPTDYAIILGGGKGLRMGYDVPKQFLPVGGIPILMRTIRRFREYSDSLKIILVLPASWHGHWQRLCEEYGFCEDYEIADGGETRFHSIRNGLSLVPDDAVGVVAVHDGVRPFPSVEVIARCFETARNEGTAVPVTEVIETLRHVDENGASVTVPRGEYRSVQTPQAFDIQLHKRAYRQDYSEGFTDDASVVESLGRSITLVAGNRENIKITTPFDMCVAEALAAERKPQRTPHGDR